MNRTATGGRDSQSLVLMFSALALWALQGLLAVVFLAHGLLFLFPPADVAPQMNAAFPRWFQLFMGFAELAAFVGLVLPAAVRRHQWLMVWAALGTVIVLASATVLHTVRGEYSSAVITVVLLAMAVTVAWGRRRMLARKAGRSI